MEVAEYEHRLIRILAAFDVVIICLETTAAEEVLWKLGDGRAEALALLEKRPMGLPASPIV